MKRTYLFVLFIYLIVSASHAQEKRSFWNHGIGKVLKSADDLINRWQDEGVDTNYICKQKLDRMVYLGYYGYFQQHDMTFPILVNDDDVPYNPQFMPPNIEQNKYVKADMHTYQSEVELGIDWRGVAIEIPIPIRSRYSLSLGLAKTGSVWGARVRYKSISRMEGLLADSYNQALAQWKDNETTGEANPVVPENSLIQSGRLGLKIFYAEAYYVFNNKRFSLAASVYGDMVQKRSAGGIFVMANYYQSRFASSQLFNSDRDTFRNWKISVGPGYGYNWSLLDGRMCLHASFIPMISIKNHLVHKNYNYSDHYANADMSAAPSLSTAQITSEREKWANYDEHYYRAVDDGRSRFVFNCFARLALSYSYDRYLFNFLANYRQYLYRNNANTKINNREAEAQINIGYRF